ncbi:MAG: hypothetical protein ACSW8C_01100 [bacterium]
MINFFLLPFRGLVWLVLGSIFSLPWLIVLLPLTTSYWLPQVLSYGFEYKTHAKCDIDQANINWVTGEIILKDVSVFNPTEFHTADCMKFGTIRCKLEPLSLLGSYLHIRELSFDCRQMSFIKQNSSNNFLSFGRLFAGNSKRNFIIDNLNFNFNGFVTIKSYDMMFVRGSEFFTKKNFTFSNVCRDVQIGQKLSSDPIQSLESVYNTLGTLFKNERPL